MKLQWAHAALTDHRSIFAYIADDNPRAALALEQVFLAKAALTGNRLNNALTGGMGADEISGGRGNDILRGQGGADVLKGDSGNDIFYIADETFSRIDGGAGIDSLVFDYGGAIDLAI